MRWIALVAMVGCAHPAATPTPSSQPEPTEPEPSQALACEGFDPNDYADQPARFELDPDDPTRGILSGFINGKTPRRFDAFIEQNPNVRTLVMPFVPGSANDEANLRVARRVHALGLDTCVPSTGMIASGGVDFFLAGARRSAADGAQVGVHSWAAGFGTEGGELPEDHPDHDFFLDYYAEIGIDASFYWFTLEAAPSWDIHWMSRDEMARYAVEAR